MKYLLSLALLVALPIAALGKEDLSKYTGTYKGETRARGETRDQSHDGAFATRHHTMTLSLGDDGSATLTQCPDAVTEITSFAHWTHQGDQIKLIFDPVDKHPTPAPMSFRWEHRTLTPLVWSHDLWRTLPPPPMKRMKQHDPGDDL